MSTRQPIIQLRNLVKIFAASVTAVDNVCLDIEAGEFFALLGPSGCGKTTLLRLIAGLEVPTAGDIVIDRQPMAGVPPNRRPVNMVFQSYAVFPHMTVIDNVKVPSVAAWIQLVPNSCRADLNDDNVVDAADLALLLAAWGACPPAPAFCLADFNCDGEVEAFDLAILLGAWGACGRGFSSGGIELIDALLEMGYANVPEHTAWSTAAPPEDAFASGQQLLELLGE